MVEALRFVTSVPQIVLSIWDRALRYNPTATLLAKPIIPGSAQIVPSIQVKNNAPRPIIVRWENGAHGHFRIAADNSAEGVFGITPPQVVIDPGDERELVVLKPVGFNQMPPHAAIVADLKWRFAQPYRWRPERTLTVWTTKEDLQALLGHPWDI